MIRAPVNKRCDGVPNAPVGVRAAFTSRESGYAAQVSTYRRRVSRKTSDSRTTALR
jgi:hypothetical protein